MNARSKIVSAFWGLVLIVFGAWLLIVRPPILIRGDEFAPSTWILIFSGVSALFLSSYILSGIRAWGWLFPTFIFGSIALIIQLSEMGITSAVIGVPVILSIGLPFMVPFILDRRQNWWALIPLWVFMVIAAIVSMADRVPGELIGTMIQFAIALPFVVVFLVNRSQKWALIPATVLSATGLITLIATQGESDLIGAIIMLVLAAPFFGVYFMNANNWWALIPAGILASIAVEVGLDGINPTFFKESALPVTVMFLGWALTFGLLWLRRENVHTQWAIYPAVIFVIFAGLTILGGYGVTWWPVALIVLGLFMMYRTLRPRAI